MRNAGHLVQRKHIQSLRTFTCTKVTLICGLRAESVIFEPEHNVAVTLDGKRHGKTIIDFLWAEADDFDLDDLDFLTNYCNIRVRPDTGS